MHGTQHAGNELVDSIALQDEGNQSRNTTLVVGAAAEVREYELLEGIDLVLQRHEIRDGLVSLVGVIDGLETDVLLILERAVELWVLAVEGQLGGEVVDVLGDERRISSHAIAGSLASRQALEPAGVRLRLLEDGGVAFLEDFVDGDERLECLDLVGEDWLAVARSALQ